MRTLTIKNIPDELYEKLKERAKANHRSISDEVLFIIQLSFSQKMPEKADTLLEGPGRVREVTAENPITADGIEEAINEGRS